MTLIYVKTQRAGGAGDVVEEVSVDDVGKLALEATLRFLGRLQLGDLAVVVLATKATVAGLDGGNGVQGGAELEVPRPVQPMTGSQIPENHGRSFPIALRG